MDKNTLLPCPCCKQSPNVSGHTGAVSIYCLNEGCMQAPGLTTYSLEYAISLWNKLANQ